MASNRFFLWAVPLIVAAALLAGAAGAGTASATGAPAALWIGDSYTMGAGVTKPWLVGEAYVTSKMLGRNPELDAVGGTGFVVASKFGPPVPARLDRDKGISPVPSFVLIDAGRNDLRIPQRREHGAVLATFRKVARLFPKATVVVIAPWAMRSKPNDYRELRTFLGRRARLRGWAFVDPLSEGWVNKVSARLTGPGAAIPAFHAALSAECTISGVMSSSRRPSRPSPSLPLIHRMHRVLWKC
jgi:hypothetical protein